MATLTPQDFCSVADGGHVEVDVDPTGHGDAELWERVVPFGTTATATSPPFRRVNLVFTEGGVRYSRRAPVGSLYQARLFPRGAVPADRGPTDRDRPIGTVDLPCLFVEARLPDLLTRCRTDRAQLTLDVGDTWVGAVLVTGALPTRMLLLVGADEPAMVPLGGGQWPRFGERTPLASASSPGAARVHRVYAPPRVLLPAEDGIDPRTTVHYAAVVWTADGRWDFVWADDGVGGTGRPQALQTRTREIGVTVDRLTCLDDGFEHDFSAAWTTPDGTEWEDGPLGAGTGPFEDDSVFRLVLSLPGNVGLQLTPYLWRDMDSTESVTPSHFELAWSGGAEGHGARITLASAGADGSVDVPIGAGEGARSSTHQVRIVAPRIDGTPGFLADLTVTVGCS